MIEEYELQLMKYISKPNKRAASLHELDFYNSASEAEKEEYEEALRQLISKGDVIINEYKKIVLPIEMNIYKGTFVSLGNCDGYVIVNQDSSIYVYGKNNNNAIHKDQVLVQILEKKLSPSGKRCGTIIKILSKGYNIVVGTYGYLGKKPVVFPDDKKIAEYILITKQSNRTYVDHKVIVRITSTTKGLPNGKVLKSLGHKNAPGVDILSIVDQLEIPRSFTKKVIKSAEKLPDTVLDEDTVNRTDLQQELTITIDGEDTKDIDDAVSLKKLPDNNYELTVSIADVSHYVKKGGSLDKEAMNRGTSIYLADRVIPMLPVQLSNGICSLNEKVKRLALSCRMTIDNTGNCIDHEIFESVLMVDYKMTYTMIQEMLEDEHSPLNSRYSEVYEMIKQMNELRQILQKKRKDRGAIDFDVPETVITLDSFGKTLNVEARSRNISTAIIEELMILCNETVAEEYFWLALPFVYRCHQEPDMEKTQELLEFVNSMGHSLKGRLKSPKSFQVLLDKVKGTPEEMVISKQVLHSLKQARYMSDNIGHFGIASKHYCHFTSPIRRYPDLQIHRIIKNNINHNLGDEETAELKGLLNNVCALSNLTERRAQSCERKVEALKKVEFMSDKIGECFDGVITSITNWGIYVALPNTIEGMISVMSLKDNNLDNYYLGKKVRIRVHNVNLEERKLDFRLVSS